MNEIVSTNWNYPTPIWFGLSRRLEIIEALNELSITKPMIVTDPNFAENEKFVDILAILKKNQIEYSVFSNIKGNPTGMNVTDGVAQFNSSKSDGVIIIGGGSSLDAGKAIAFMSKQKENLWFFEDVSANWKQAVTDNLPQVIAMPTTSGTGSETGRASHLLWMKRI